MLTVTRPQNATQALGLAVLRGLLPTALGSEEISQLDAALRARSFFSARTTSAGYLQALHDLVQRYLQGGYNNDRAQLRVEARQMLAHFGYSATGGFPGDEGQVPPAAPGSLQDLGSEARLNLIFDTQAELMRGLGQKLRGATRMKQFPAWELVRTGERKVPRGSPDSKSKGWPERWDMAGGVLVAGKMIARKDADVWSSLGDSTLFDDALDTDHPPFAFNSGMGWREVPHDELAGYGWHIPASEPQRIDLARERQIPPVSDKLAPDIRAALRKKLADYEARNGTLTMAQILDRAKQVHDGGAA